MTGVTKEENDDMTMGTDAKVEITVKNWDGNYRPFRGTVRIDGVLIGHTGACKSMPAARRLAEAMARAAIAKAESR